MTGFSQLSKDLNDFQDDILYFLKIYFEKAIEIVTKYVPISWELIMNIIFT